MEYLGIVVKELAKQLEIITESLWGILQTPALIYPLGFLRAENHKA